MLKISPEEPTKLGINNQGALVLVSNPIMYFQSKHIWICYHAICDFIKYRDINVRYVPTKDMLADRLTKAINVSILEHMVKSLHLSD